MEVGQRVAAVRQVVMAARHVAIAVAIPRQGWPVVEGLSPDQLLLWNAGELSDLRGDH